MKLEENIQLNLTKLVVTGTSGYIGRSLINELNDPEVVCFSRRESSHINATEYVVPDIADFYKVIREIDRVHSIVHLAALAHNKCSSINEYMRVNYTEALNFAREAATLGVKRFIYLSTANVYGLGAQTSPFIEDCIGSSLDAISDIRLQFEKALLELGQELSMQVVILRCPLVYSLSAPANFGKFVKLTSRSRILPFGSFKSKRSYLSLNNLLSAILQVISTNSNKSGVYNITDDHDISMVEMSNLVANYHGIRPIQVHIPHLCIKFIDYVVGGNNFTRLFLTAFQVNCEKFKREFNWVPVQTPSEHFNRLRVFK